MRGINKGREPDEDDKRPLVRFLTNPASIVVCPAPESWETGRPCATCGAPVKPRFLVEDLRCVCVKCGETLYIPDKGENHEV